MESAGADWIHVDVMDGHFVPGLTMGPGFVRALRPCTGLPIDVHLMVADPARLAVDFAEAGADTITVHVEACANPSQVLSSVRGLGTRAGISLKPETPLTAITEALPSCDLVLVMTVNPGKGGQTFIEDQLEKIAALRSQIDALGLDIDLEVDGGITPETAQAAIGAGADVLVAGTAAFVGGNSAYTDNLKALRGE